MDEDINFKCKNCGKWLDKITDDAYVCICGVVDSVCLTEDCNVSWTDWGGRTWQRRSSVYKPVTYGKHVIMSLMGEVQPTLTKKYPTVLCLEECRGIMEKVSNVFKKNKISLKDVVPSDVRSALKQLNLGRYYKYSLYMTERLNPRFCANYLSDAEISQLLYVYKLFSKTFRDSREEIQRLFGVRRKNMPYVPTVVSMLMKEMGMDPKKLWLMELKSRKRSMETKKIVGYVISRMNFLLNGEEINGGSASVVQHPGTSGGSRGRKRRSSGDVPESTEGTKKQKSEKKIRRGIQHDTIGKIDGDAGSRKREGPGVAAREDVVDSETGR